MAGLLAAPKLQFKNNPKRGLETDFNIQMDLLAVLIARTIAKGKSVAWFYVEIFSDGKSDTQPGRK